MLPGGMTTFRQLFNTPARSFSCNLLPLLFVPEVEVMKDKKPDGMR
jgi:hypothetical protein